MAKGSLTGAGFEALVRGAVKGLPKEFKRKLENINIVIREEPSARHEKRKKGSHLFFCLQSR